MLGCLVGGFYLLRLHDIVVASFAGMLVNLAAAGRAWTGAAAFPTVPGKQEGRGHSAKTGPAPRNRAVLWIAALSGASALGADGGGRA